MPDFVNLQESEAAFDPNPVVATRRLAVALAAQPPKAETPAGVGEALNTLRPIFKDKRRSGLTWNDAEAEKAFDTVVAALSAAPAARPGDGVERYTAGAMDMRDRVADALNALMHRMSADGLSPVCQAVLADATLMVRALPLAAAPAADGGRA